MGRKIDALLRRSFKPAKFKPLVKVAMTRISLVKTQRQARLSQARSDVVQLLNLGHHERALLRVEQVIKEQNMMDVFVMMESYCLLLIERIDLIEQERECPDELKEAISSLIYAASRSGELPEVQEIRAVLTSRYGKDFAARAIELRNNCGVDPRIIQKLSTRMPSLESRIVALKEIAAENGIALQLEDTSEMAKENLQSSLDQNQSKPDPVANSNSVKVGDGLQMFPELIEKDEGFSGSVKTKYRDVAHAAQAAFESAANAAEAARAAVELSRSDSHDPDDHNSPRPRQKKLWDSEELMKSKSDTAGGKESGMGEKSDMRSEFDKVDPSENYDSESGDEEIHETSQDEESKQSENAVELKESSSSSSGTSGVLGPPKRLGKEIAFDESDDENVKNQHGVLQALKTNKVGFHMKPSPLKNEDHKIEEHNSAANDPLAESGEKLHYLSQKQMYTRFQARLNVAPGHEISGGYSAEGSGIRSAHALNIEKKPISMRTTGVHVR